MFTFGFFVELFGFVVFGLDVFSDINLSIIPILSSSDALLSAKQNLPFSITESKIEENLKILPIPKNGNYEYHLVYVVHFSTKNNIGPAEYVCYVDANTGELLMRRNEIKFELPQANIHVKERSTQQILTILLQSKIL